MHPRENLSFLIFSSCSLGWTEATSRRGIGIGHMAPDISLSLLGRAPDDLAWYSTSKTHSQKNLRGQNMFPFMLEAFLFPKLPRNQF